MTASTSACDVRPRLAEIIPRAHKAKRRSHEKTKFLHAAHARRRLRGSGHDASGSARRCRAGLAACACRAADAPESFLSKVLQSLDAGWADYVAPWAGGRICDLLAGHTWPPCGKWLKPWMGPSGLTCVSCGRPILRAQIVVSRAPGVGARAAGHDGGAGKRHGRPAWRARRTAPAIQKVARTADVDRGTARRPPRHQSLSAAHLPIHPPKVFQSRS